MSDEASRRAAGRPRDTSIDRRVLAATRELLATSGFEGTTVQAIAARAGVHASAIYRRWPSRIEIIEHAIFPGLAPLDVDATGDLHRDLRRFVRAYLALIGEPAARAAMPGLMAYYQSSGRFPPAEAWLAVSARPQFRDILAAAIPAQVDVDIDPDDVFDVVMGAILARILIPAVAQRNRPIERLVELAVRLVQPAAAEVPR